MGVASSRWEDTFPPHEDVAARARDAVEEALTQGRVDTSTIADALLVLNELVANAIRHARTEFTVTALVAGNVLRLEVFDRDTRPPMLLALDAESTSGRGLNIVAGIAQDWGWQTGEGDDGLPGKVVWAELGLADSVDGDGDGDRDGDGDEDG